MDGSFKGKAAPEYRASPRPMYQEIIAVDAVKAPAPFLDYAETNVACATVPRSRYTSAEFARLETERMWSRVWQVACREEQVPEPGDCHVYEGPGASILVVRGDDNQIRAFYNSCPHRGMKLFSTDTCVAKITCPFHSFQWSLNGQLSTVPQKWDFAEFPETHFGLSSVKVGVWGGFVFINRDPDCRPLEDYLGHLPSHFEGWDRSEVYASKIIRKTVLANWKICIEGFLEAYHISGVHAQALPFGGDSSVQYDVWPDDPNVSRFLQPLAFQSDQQSGSLSEQEILDAAVKTIFGPTQKFALATDQTARQFLTSAIRSAIGDAEGEDYSGLSDTEATDAMQYSLFPNLVVFRSLPYPLAYRFLPVANDPGRTIFDMFVFKPKKAGEPIPPTEIIEVDADTSYAEAGALAPWLAQIYDQDAGAFPLVQAGLRDGGDAPVTYSRYQEVRIRHLQNTLTRYVETPPGQPMR